MSPTWVKWQMRFTVRSNIEMLSTAVAILLSCLPSCTIVNGQPWGEIEAVVFLADFPLVSPRLLDDGSLQTANDYHIAIDEVLLQYSGVTFMIAQGNGNDGFDAANPPEGCSLCHNGHCHCDQELVSYAELESQVQSSGGGSESVVLPMEGEMPALVPNDGSVVIPILDCGNEDKCLLPRGNLKSILVNITSIELDITVTDGRTGNLMRLDGPLEVKRSLNINAQLPILADETFDRDSPPELSVDISHQIPPSLFDGVEDWMAFESSPEAIAEIIEDNIVNGGGLTIELTREENPLPMSIEEADSAF
jgi:hypothetical protein